MSASIPNISYLTSRVIRVLGCNPGTMTLQGTNTYVIGTGKRRVLLDSGDRNKPQYINNLKSVLQDNNISLEHVIITHWHMDHIGGVPEVMKLALPDCKVWKYPRSDAESKPTNNAPEKQEILHLDKINKLSNGQLFEVEGATLRVVHTPGHTTDHIVLQLKEENAVFSGDCVLGEGTAVFEDLLSYMDSLKLIQTLHPEIIYPGHGPEIKNPDEVLNFYINHRIQRENDIIDLLEKSFNNAMTCQEITAELYKAYPEAVQVFANYVISKHLEKLGKEGRAIEKDNKWRLHVKNNI